MKFFYEDNDGNKDYFEEENLVKAIYTAWNIVADLYIYTDGDFQPIFLPHESNGINSKLLQDYGYKVRNGHKYREIVEVETGKVIRYEWFEVRQLL